MSKHGLTRVVCKGGKVVVVAGAVPQSIAETAESMSPAKDPTKVKHIPVKPIPPARVPKGLVVPKDAKNQAEPAAPVEEKK